MPDLQGQPGRQVRGGLQRGGNMPCVSSWPAPPPFRASRCPHIATDRRDFVLSGYQELKKANPTFPILVREASGVEAKLIARYGAWGCRGTQHGQAQGAGVRRQPPAAPAEAPRVRSSARRRPRRLPWKRLLAHAAPPAPSRPADFGVEEAVKLEGLGKADVVKQLEALVKKGESMPRSTESEGKL